MEGSQACVVLTETVKKLGELGAASEWVNTTVNILAECKAYLKMEFKSHLSLDSECADHCLVHALSTEDEFKMDCAHSQQLQCPTCELLRVTIDEIEAVFDMEVLTYRYAEQKEELFDDFQKANSSIISWKSHLLRSVNQNRGKTDVIDNLGEDSILIIMDWAMKFQPSKFRETQQEWYGKKGRSWHVSAVVFNINGQIKCKTYVHVMDNCTQNWYAVYSVIENLLSTVQQSHKNIKMVYFRSDNAGCYHNAPLMLSLGQLSKRSGIFISRYDFSEAQAGKDLCDRKIAPMKAQIRRYVDEGNDVLDAKGMKQAIESAGGVKGCSIAVVSIQVSNRNIIKHSWSGISQYNGFMFQRDGSIRVWKAFDIGSGKVFGKEILDKFAVFQGPADLQVHEPFAPAETEYGEVRRNVVASTGSFVCTEDGCIQTFVSCKDLESHLDFGSHNFRSESSADAVLRQWAERCTEVTSTHKVVKSLLLSATDDSSEDAGWAIRQARKAKRFSGDVKMYLLNVFKIGEATNRKADPKEVAMRMKSDKIDGKKKFRKEDWLSPQQIASYFSRLSSLNKKHLLEAESTLEIDDVDSVYSAMHRADLVEAISSSL